MAAWTSSTGTGCVFLCIVRQPPGSGLFPPLGYFRKKEKHLLASLPKREAAPCAFAAARPPPHHTSGLARRKIFPIPFPVYHISQVCLVDFCRDTSIFLIPCCGGKRSLSLYYPTTYALAIGLLQKAAFSGKR